MIYRRSKVSSIAKIESSLTHKVEGIGNEIRKKGGLESEPLAETEENPSQDFPLLVFFLFPFLSNLVFACSSNDNDRSAGISVVLDALVCGQCLVKGHRGINSKEIGLPWLAVAMSSCSHTFTAR